MKRSRRLYPKGMKFGKHRSWKKANQRRQELILKKYVGGGRTSEEEREYKVLDRMANRVVNWADRSLLRHLNKTLKLLQD